MDVKPYGGFSTVLYLSLLSESLKNSHINMAHEEWHKQSTLGLTKF